jgi:hypothetical protein
MTLRRTEIIEWSTTPQTLRAIADLMETFIESRQIQSAPHFYYEVKEGNLKIIFTLEQGQWQAEQVEDKE